MIARVEECLQAQQAELTGTLAEVCRYAVEGGGRTRARLLLSASGGASDSDISAATSLELLHSATLLQDDIFDGSARRRDRTAAHVRFGKAQAILASDWLLIRALELAATVHPAFFRHLSGAARTMTQAVATELRPDESYNLEASEQAALSVAQGKTATLFASALFGAALLRHRSSAELVAWQEVGRRIGMVYQMVDDCLDVYAEAEAVGKEVGCDLAAGHLTLPLLQACRVMRAEGRGPCMVRLQSAQLTTDEVTDIQVALQGAAVRQTLHERSLHDLTETLACAEQVGVPQRSLSHWAADMRHKLQLCFGAKPETLPAAQNPSLGGQTSGEEAMAAQVC